MHEGRVFQMDLHRHAGVTDLYEDRFDEGAASQPRFELFWLCDECAQCFTLVVHGGNAITLEPLKDYEPLARAC